MNEYQIAVEGEMTQVVALMLYQRIQEVVKEVYTGQVEVFVNVEDESGEHWKIVAGRRVNG